MTGPLVYSTWLEPAFLHLLENSLSTFWKLPARYCVMHGLMPPRNINIQPQPSFHGLKTHLQWEDRRFINKMLLWPTGSFTLTCARPFASIISSIVHAAIAPASVDADCGLCRLLTEAVAGKSDGCALYTLFFHCLCLLLQGALYRSFLEYPTFHSDHCLFICLLQSFFIWHLCPVESCQACHVINKNVVSSICLNGIYILQWSSFWTSYHLYRWGELKRILIRFRNATVILM